MEVGLETANVRGNYIFMLGGFGCSPDHVSKYLARYIFLARRAYVEANSETFTSITNPNTYSLQNNM